MTEDELKQGAYMAETLLERYGRNENAWLVLPQARGSYFAAGTLLNGVNIEVQYDMYSKLYKTDIWAKTIYQEMSRIYTGFSLDDCLTHCESAFNGLIIEKVNTLQKFFLQETP